MLNPDSWQIPRQPLGGQRIDEAQLINEMIATHMQTMARCVENARQAGCMPHDYAVFCIKTGTIWDDVIRHFSPYRYPAVQTVEVAIKVVKWTDFIVHLQAIPHLQMALSAARQEVLRSGQIGLIYPGVVLGNDYALHMIIRR